MQRKKVPLEKKSDLKTRNEKENLCIGKNQGSGPS